jgi:hypothetical protein
MSLIESGELITVTDTIHDRSKMPNLTPKSYVYDSKIEYSSDNLQVTIN